MKLSISTTAVLLAVLAAGANASIWKAPCPGIGVVTAHCKVDDSYDGLWLRDKGANCNAQTHFCKCSLSAFQTLCTSIHGSDYYESPGTN